MKPKIVKEICDVDYSPSILIADNAHQITNGFVNIFGQPEHVNNFFYVLMLLFMLLIN